LGKIFDDKGRKLFDVTLIASSIYNTINDDWSMYGLNTDDKFVISFIAKKLVGNTF